MSDSIRVIDLPDLGVVSDASSFVADRAGTGRFTAVALKNYCYGLPDAPSDSVAYGRFNANWAPVPAEAPSDGSTYGRLNDAWTQVMPLTGGGVTGNISVNGNVTATNLYGDSLFLGGPGYPWEFYIEAGTNNHVQNHAANCFDKWFAADGSRQWAAPGVSQMTLSPTGDLTLAGVAVATGFWDGGPGSFGFGAGGSGRIFQFSPAFFFDYSTANATLQWTVTNGPLWVMRAADDFCFNPQSSVGGNGAYVNSSDRRLKSKVAPTTKGLAEVLQLQPVSFVRDNAATGAAEEIGFVAQDVQPIVPEAVWTAGIPMRDGSGGLDSPEPTLGLTSETITAISVNAIKELHTMIDALTTRLASLEGNARGTR